MANSRWERALEDQEELNTLLQADPELCLNMAEMGFIKLVPFQRDHNEATVAQWVWTDYGRREFHERLIARAEFQKGNSSVN